MESDASIGSGPNPRVPDRAERVPTSAQSKLRPSLMHYATTSETDIALHQGMESEQQYFFFFFNLGNPGLLLKDWIVEHTNV